MTFIGIDLGTTNLKAALYSGPALTQAAISSRPLEYTRMKNKVEFDANAVADAVFDMLRELSGKAPDPVVMITLTEQAESLILLGENRSPLRPAIS
jgi:xylulokinase